MLKKIYSIFYSYVLRGNYFRNKCARTNMRSPSSILACAAGYMHRKTMAAKRIYCPQYKLYAAYVRRNVCILLHIDAHAYLPPRISFSTHMRFCGKGVFCMKARAPDAHGAYFSIFLHFLQKYFLIKKSGRIKNSAQNFYRKNPKKIPVKNCGNFLSYKIMQITPPLPSLAILVMAFLSLERVSS